MPLFICDICSGIENTASGFYWGRDNEFIKWKNPENNGKAFCSECAPTEMEDGKLYQDHTGTWHGEFPKRIATEEIVRERGLEESSPGGFVYLGQFEYLRPEFMKQARSAARKAKRAAKKGGP